MSCNVVSRGIESQIEGKNDEPVGPAGLIQMIYSRESLNKTPHANGRAQDSLILSPLLSHHFNGLKGNGIKTSESIDRASCEVYVSRKPGGNG